MQFFFALVFFVGVRACLFSCGGSGGRRVVCFRVRCLFCAMAASAAAFDFVCVVPLAVQVAAARARFLVS